MAEGDKPNQKPQRVFIGDSLNFPLFNVGTPMPSRPAAPKRETTTSNAKPTPTLREPGSVPKAK